MTEKGAMLGVLDRAEALLRDPGRSPLLDDVEAWAALDFRYRSARSRGVFRFERLRYPLGSGRKLFLNRIHPYDDDLWHPHPWPAAVKVLSGSYEMGVGHAVGDVRPTAAVTLVLPAGSRYEMTDEHGWHYVRPVDAASYSVMVTGKSWGHLVDPDQEREVDPDRDGYAVDLLRWFASFYGVTSSTHNGYVGE